MAYLVTSDSVNLFYKDWCTGAPVVFLHSWALSSAMWQYQMNFLAEHGFRCIAYDRRGHGRSDQPWDGYEFDRLADDLATVLDQLELQQVTLVGHSTGTGEIVRYLARHGSGRIARIVLVSSTLPRPVHTPADIAGYDRLRAQWRADFPSWVGRMMRSFFGTTSPEGSVSQELIEWTVADSRAVSVRAMLALSHTITETDHSPDLRRIEVPALLIHGEADTVNLLERCGRSTARLIPGSVLKVYHDAPHGLHLTHGEQLNADLLDFVKQ